MSGCFRFLIPSMRSARLRMPHTWLGHHRAAGGRKHPPRIGSVPRLRLALPERQQAMRAESGHHCRWFPAAAMLSAWSFYTIFVRPHPSQLAGRCDADAPTGTVPLTTRSTGASRLVPHTHRAWPGCLGVEDDPRLVTVDAPFVAICRDLGCLRVSTLRRGLSR
jgi:hypothetical protein